MKTLADINRAVEKIDAANPEKPVLIGYITRTDETDAEWATFCLDMHVGVHLGRALVRAGLEALMMTGAYTREQIDAMWPE